MSIFWDSQHLQNWLQAGHFSLAFNCLLTFNSFSHFSSWPLFSFPDLYIQLLTWHLHLDVAKVNSTFKWTKLNFQVPSTFPSLICTSLSFTHLSKWHHYLSSCSNKRPLCGLYLCGGLINVGLSWGSHLLFFPVLWILCISWYQAYSEYSTDICWISVFY